MIKWLCVLSCVWVTSGRPCVTGQELGRDVYDVFSHSPHTCTVVVRHRTGYMPPVNYVAPAWAESYQYITYSSASVLHTSGVVSAETFTTPTGAMCLLKTCDGREWKTVGNDLPFNLAALQTGLLVGWGFWVTVWRLSGFGGVSTQMVVAVLPVACKPITRQVVTDPTKFCF